MSLGGEAVRRRGESAPGTKGTRDGRPHRSLGMNWSPIPPAVAAVVAVAMAVNRRLAPILLETSIGVPSPRVLAAYTFGGRFVTFALVYGLLFGVAVAVGRRRRSTEGDSATVLATGVVAAVAYLGASAALLFVLDPRPILVNAVAGVGSAVGVGVQLAVVAFAGFALAERV